MKPFLAVSVFLGSFIYRFYFKYWGLYVQPEVFCMCTENFTHGNADFQVLWSHFFRLVPAALVHPCVRMAGVWYPDSSLPCAEAPGWSMVLELGAAFGHQVVQAQNHTPLQDLGQNSSPHCQQPPSGSWRPGERQPPKVSQPHSCSRSLPVVSGEVLLLLQMWEGVHTLEIGPYMPDCKKPALVTHYPESAGWLSDSL